MSAETSLRRYAATGRDVLAPVLEWVLAFVTALAMQVLVVVSFAQPFGAGIAVGAGGAAFILLPAGKLYWDGDVADAKYNVRGKCLLFGGLTVFSIPLAAGYVLSGVPIEIGGTTLLTLVFYGMAFPMAAYMNRPMWFSRVPVVGDVLVDHHGGD